MPRLPELKLGGGFDLYHQPKKPDLIPPPKNFRAMYPGKQRRSQIGVADLLARAKQMDRDAHDLWLEHDCSFSGVTRRQLHREAVGLTLKARDLREQAKRLRASNQGG